MDLSALVKKAAASTPSVVPAWSGLPVTGACSGTFSFESVALPVEAVKVGGTGPLRGASGLTSDGSGFCALMTSTGLDYWGDDNFGQLGDGVFYTGADNYVSAVPVQVLGAGGTGTLTAV